MNLSDMYIRVVHLKKSHKDRSRYEDMKDKLVFMCIKSFDNAWLIFEDFWPKKPLDNENTCKMNGIFAMFSDAIYAHLKTFFIKDD